MHRPLLRSVLMAAAAVLAAPLATAGAATTTVGDLSLSTATAPSGAPTCSQPCTAAIASLPEPELARAKAGVITTWRVRAGAGSSAGAVALRVIKPALPATAPFSAIGAGVSAAQTLQAGVNVFPTRLAIGSGDLIGVDLPGSEPLVSRPGAGASFVRWLPPLPLGQQYQQSGAPISNSRLLINADIEPDVDMDGYGDETQDLCSSNAGTQNACPQGESPPVEMGRLRLNRYSGTATLPFKVPVGGRLHAYGPGIKTYTSNPKTSRTLKMLVKAHGRWKRRLQRTGRIRLELTVSFTASGSDPYYETTPLILRKRRF